MYGYIIERRNRMPVLRVKKSKNFTVMSNYHLRDKNLSLKAKGLLSVMLSLPENWDYSIKGLSCICKEGVFSIRNAVRELEKQNYIVRHITRNKKGFITHSEYMLYEQPVHINLSIPEMPTSEKPMQDDPMQENPILEAPILENCT